VRRQGWLCAAVVSALACGIVLCSCNGGGGDGSQMPSEELQPPENTPPRSVSLTRVVTGLAEPAYITHAGDDRLFLVERAGRIRISHQGTLLATPFLDITQLVVSLSGERGLFSVAFHPQYNTPGAAGAGLFWVNYTDTQGDTVIARYTVSSPNPDQADPASAYVLLTIVQPFGNHNGGQLQFGPVEGSEQKRYLYIGMGDGGSGGDPDNHGQRDDSLLGKMLRVDPSTDAVPIPPFYTIPPDNPRPTAASPLDTVWAKGLRNPWRFSFDAERGDLYIADVGQHDFEEVNVTRAATPAELNYGWRIMEGLECFNPPSGCDRRGLVLPVFVYAIGGASSRCAIIGGYVYRGARFPALTGMYLYADLCSGEIFGLDETSSGTWESTLLHSSDFRPLTFGEDAAGEVYIGGDDGNVYQIVME